MTRKPIFKQKIRLRRRPGIGTALLAAAFAVGLFAVPRSALAAEEPGVYAKLGDKTLYVGQTTDYQVVVANLRNPPQPDMSAFQADFAVRSLGSHDQSSSQVTVINGRITRVEQLARTFRYELTPKRAGLLKVPPATVEADGKTYQSQEFELRVKEPEDQDLVKMTVTAEPETVYPTQSFDVVLSVAVKAIPEPDEDRQPVISGRSGPPRQIGRAHV